MEKQRGFSAEALKAFRMMLYHKSAMWDESFELESLLKCEVDTGHLDHPAVNFSGGQDVLDASDSEILEVMQDWMSYEDNAKFYEEDE
jgi:hypothetical protein